MLNNTEECSGEERKVKKMAHQQEKDKMERATGLSRRICEGTELKIMKSNDTPEIPDSGYHQTSPASLRGKWVLVKAS